MDLDQYQRTSAQFAGRCAPELVDALTAGLGTGISNRAQYTLNLFTAGIGVAEEAGELAGLIKKHLGHEHPLDREKVIKEMGDVLWYLAYIGTLLDINLSDVARVNREKLSARYPNGFTAEASRNRGSK